MAIIADNIRPEVQKYLDALKETVTVDFYPHPENPSTQPMRELLLELHDISGKIDVIEHNQSPTPIAPETAEELEGPVTTFSVAGQFTGIRYLGFPGGHEFSAFLEDIVDVSTNKPSDISQATRDWLQGLTQPLHLEVFVTPT